MPSPGRLRLSLALAAGAAVLAAPAQAATPADVQRGLERLVAADGGPPGAIATLHRDGEMTVLRAGRADVERRSAPRAGDHMRIASITKAFTATVALRLVQDGRLGLDDTIGERLPDLPAAWSRVTVRQMLQHTSGLPDYTRSKAFARQARTDPRGFVSPQGIIDWVRRDGLVFRPGSRYAYSNTDNIVVGLIAEELTGRPYRALLEQDVFGPAGLRATTLPTRSLAVPRPAIHGYVVEAGSEPQDVTSFLSPSGAWASGAILSTPTDLAAFIRAYLDGTLVAPEQQREQLRFVRGASSPPGPGANSAGLSVFRYRTSCGTVYGHTGNFPGYVQWAAATRDGSRSVTTTLNIPAPEGALLRRLRAVQRTAVCALLAR